MLPVRVLDDVCEFVVKAVEEEVFVIADVFVNASVAFIVKEGSDEELMAEEGLTLNDGLTDLVEVLDIVVVELGTRGSPKSSLLKLYSFNSGGVVPTNPIVNSTKSQRIPIYYIGYSSFLGTTI